MPDLNIFNLDFGNLAKLINKGRVDKVYYKMYKVAENASRVVSFRTFPKFTGFTAIRKGKARDKLI